MKKLSIFVLIIVLIMVSPGQTALASNAAAASCADNTVGSSGTDSMLNPYGTDNAAVPPGTDLCLTVASEGETGNNAETVSSNVTQIHDEITSINVEVSYESPDAEVLGLLRTYYGDISMTEDQLFHKFIELKKSYVRALESLYNTGSIGSSGYISETALHIFHEGSEKLYGLDNCSVFLYNIVRYEGREKYEQINLDIIIPLPSDFSVIAIRFAIPWGNSPDLILDTISAIFSGIRINDLYLESELPAVLQDRELIEASCRGIYPAPNQADPDYTVLDFPAAGYSLYLPDTYLPFIQNNLGGMLSYNSFKIDPGLIFSVSAGPLHDLYDADAIGRFKVASLSSISITDSGDISTGSNDYRYLFYVGEENGISHYFYDYYTQNENTLFKLRLHSYTDEPVENVKKQMEEILAGFQPGKGMSGAENINTPGTKRYFNKEEGYSFRYPGDWALEDVSTDIACDRLRLVAPGLSGALDISVQESIVDKKATFLDLLKGVDGYTVRDWQNFTSGYNPPFAGQNSRLLYSDFTINGNISALCRLIAFVDNNGRNRLCCSIDILRNHKLYSLFLTAGEYRTNEGLFDDSEINNLINTVASSFRLENTQEYENRRLQGENRNRKIAFAENYLKQVIDPRLRITDVEKIHSDKTMFLTVDNSIDSGYYKVRMDYSKKQIAILEKVLRRDILFSELSRLKESYGSRLILNSAQKESDMTLSIESRDNGMSPPLIRTYRVTVSFDGGEINWHTDRIAGQEDYMRECRQYIRSIYPSDVYFFDSYVFKDLEIYKKKGLDYPFAIYLHSPNLPGFAILSMDPDTSLFASEIPFISLKSLVSSVMYKHGIQQLCPVPDAYSFNPDNFILSLNLADRKGEYLSTEEFQIYYLPEVKALTSEKL